jgi:hypothetical protein
MNASRRLRAPRDDRGVLIDPPWSDWPRLAEADAADRSLSGRESADRELGGVRLKDFAHEARRELIEAALTYTRSYRDTNLPANLGTADEGLPSVVAAGHQPELFHPGVWAKNFALSRFAARIDAVAVNLVIDGDVLDAPSIRVPTGSPDDPSNAPRVESVPFDAAAEAVPFEERRVLDDELWRSFDRRVADTLRPLVADPLIERFWPDVVEASRRTGRIGAAVAQARHRWEGEWGARTLELPQSLLCESRSFLRFAAALAQEAPRFVEIHNRSLVEYRHSRRIRSANHPVPALAVGPGEFELPLWIWTADEPRRRHVFLRHVGGRRELTDRGRVTVELPASGRIEATIDQLAEASRQGIRLRSRALATTLFARLVLCDFFVHGIGGAKYDELTDTLIERFFEVRAPAYGVVTATRKLPIAGRGVHIHVDPSAVEHRLWEMTHHPERFLGTERLAADGTLREMVREKAALVAAEPAPADARARCHAIRELNRRLQDPLRDARQSAEEELRRATDARRVDGVVGSREYAFCLFPEKDLRNFLVEIPPQER